MHTMPDMPALARIDDLTIEQVACICDHTFLYRAESYLHTAAAGESPVRLREIAFQAFLEECCVLRPYAICVRPEDVLQAKQYLEERGLSSVMVASVVGFPDGASYSTDFKVAETRLAMSCGAGEIDTVLNYDLLKARKYHSALDDVRAVVDVSHAGGAVVKLILETAELDRDMIRRACDLAREAGADFVKTSTGFGAHGARPEDVRIMRDSFDKGVKISGGVKPGNFKSLLEAASERNDGRILLDPSRVRIGESALLGAAPQRQ